MAAALAVATIILVAVTLIRDTQTTSSTDGCPTGAVIANVTLPDDNQQVTVKVYNGSRIPGLATDVTKNFKDRRFRTEKPADSTNTLDDVAVIRYGPEAVGKAWLVRAYFLNEAAVQYDARRTGPVVDVVLGRNFRQLATLTEVSQSLAALGSPDLPPGTCPQPLP